MEDKEASNVLISFCGRIVKFDGCAYLILWIFLFSFVTAELERIKRCKGRVFPFKGEPHVARLWHPNHAGPGLAMARAFGDFCLKDCGLISVPEIYYRRITERDEFIVLATDGVSQKDFFSSVPFFFTLFLNTNIMCPY